MNTSNPFALVAPLIALQFVVFGWRIAREVALDEQDRRTWLLFADLLNLISLVTVVSFCVVLPLRKSNFPTSARAVLAASYVILTFTPFMIAGHYRLFSREGRSIYQTRGVDVPWMTGQEAFFSAAAVVGALLSGYIVSSG